MAEHTPTPWVYRPNKHDDWGWIRGPVMEGEEIGELVASAHCWATQEEKDAHRTAKTDPYAANAAFIVQAVNNHEALVKELEELREWLAGRSTSAMLQGFSVDDDAQDRIERITQVLAGVVGGSSK